MTFFQFEKRWLHLIFETILPSGADEKLTLGAKDLALDAFMDDLLKRAPERFLMGVRLGIWFIVLSPPFVLHRLRLFSSLSQEERISCLTRMNQNRFYLVREIPILLKMVATLGYCGNPAVQTQMGIDHEHVPLMEDASHE